eukprot:TRINITY_DN5228_c0_g1_i1.p1 TRINITY_DN5228_c0_g1~~TRINITY_DN5228_c0_g1_i1.p1  ORF type:complete len:299 (+),score=52.73 TRINITY_DN5228_c0_g1_i1:257-1153(+)
MRNYRAVYDNDYSGDGDRNMIDEEEERDYYNPHGEDEITYEDFMEYMKIFQTSEREKEKFKDNLRSISFKQWYNPLSIDFAYKPHYMIMTSVDDSLYKSIDKMGKERLHRCIVIDKESQTIIGSITHKDILLFAIKNLDAKETMLNLKIKDMGNLGLSEDIVGISYMSTVFDAMNTMIIRRWSSIPVVNEMNQFLGFVMKRDILFVLEDERYDMLTQTNDWFLQYIANTRSAKSKLMYEGADRYHPEESIRVVAEKIIFAPGNRLVYLDDATRMIKGIITLTDIFHYIRDEPSLQMNY